MGTDLFKKGYDHADKGYAPDPCKLKDSWDDKPLGTSAPEDLRKEQHDDYLAGYSARINQEKQKD